MRMAQSKGMRRIRNPLLRTLLDSRGNQRACLWTEPMYGIPFNLFTPLVAVYMAALGLNPLQIGLVTTAGLLAQMMAAPLGGVLTDRFGRRLTTMVVDMFAWVLPSVLWATASGFGSFLVAALLNGFWRVTETSWGLLLTEDAHPDKLIHLYAITYIAGLLAGFVSPLTYVLVEQFSLVSTMRGLYFFMAVMMALKAVGLYAITHETAIGLRRMAEAREHAVWARLLDSRHVLSRMLTSRRIMLVVALGACFATIRSVNDNFWPLLMTEKLGIPEKNLSLFNTARNLVMLVFYLVLVPRLDVRVFRKPLTWAMGLIILVDLVLFSLGQATLALVLALVTVEAVAMAVLQPLIPTLNMQAMDQEERARMLGLGTMMILLVTAPFGTLAGWLSKLDRSIPMLLNVTLAGLSVWIALKLDRQMVLDQDRKG